MEPTKKPKQVNCQWVPLAHLKQPKLGQGPGPIFEPVGLAGYGFQDPLLNQVGFMAVSLRSITLPIPQHLDWIFYHGPHLCHVLIPKA